jgi:hypothetical protein
MPGGTGSVTDRRVVDERPMAIAELEAGEVVPQASLDFSPIISNALRLSSSHLPNIGPSGAWSGDVNFESAPATLPNFPAPGHTWSRRDLGSLKRRLNRAVGLSDNSAAPENETSAFGRILGHGPPRASSSPYARNGDNEGKVKNPLWRRSSGKKKDKEKSRSFEVDRPRYDSHQGVMVCDEDENEQVGGPLRTTN